jgi:hypothetical protein
MEWIVPALMLAAMLFLVAYQLWIRPWLEAKRAATPAFTTKYGTKVYNQLPRCSKEAVDTIQDIMMEVYGRKFGWSTAQIKAVFAAQSYGIVPAPMVQSGVPVAGLTSGLSCTVCWATQLWRGALAHECLHSLRENLGAATEADELAHKNWDVCYAAIAEVNSKAEATIKPLTP